MKTKKLFGTIICTFAITAGVFIACKKEEKSAGSDTPVKTDQGTNTSSVSQRFVGTRTYYSKNNGDTVYKMVLVGTTGGDISITREIYSTSQPDTFHCKEIIEEGIEYTGLNSSGGADTLRINLDNSLQYFRIPFTPGQTPDCVIDGGSIKVYCQIECNAEAATCGLKIFTSADNSITAYCDSFCLCNLVDAGCGSPPTGRTVSSSGGFVLIEANSISVSN